MSSLILTIRDKVVKSNQIINPPVVLTEQNPASKCRPIIIQSNEKHWALRLNSDQHSPILNCSESLCGLPDYILFMESQGKHYTEIRVLSCELKSSRTGAASGIRQIQLGRFLAEYLLRLGRYVLKQPAETKSQEQVFYYGAVFCPDPKPPSPMPSTKVGRISYPSELDSLSSMHIYQLSDGIPINLRDLCF